MKKNIFRLKIARLYFDIMSDESILQCAMRNNIKMKYHCAAGFCGACKIKLISGKVKQDHNGGISRTHIANGFILACCSFPYSDVEI